MLFIWLFFIGLGSQADAQSDASNDSLRTRAAELSGQALYSEAAKTLERLKNGRDAQDYLQIGEAYLAAEKEGKARKAFKKAIDLGEKAAGHYGVGRAYEAMGSHGQLALISFRKALGEDPQFAEAQYQIAQLYRTVRPLEAEVAYRTTLSLDGEHHDAYYQLGKLLEGEGRSVEAKEAYLQQISAHPAHGFASLNLGRQMYGEGQKQAAARVFGALMASGGEVETASYLEMALMSHDARDYDNAQRLFEAYIDRLPDHKKPAFTDITHVASREDLMVLRELVNVGEEEMFRRYWNRLDPAPLTAANERLVEHYRRVAYAINRFAEGEKPFDERGRAYVRLGRPDHISRSDDVVGELQPYLFVARDNFVSWMRLGVEVRPGLPSYPVPPGARWEYWVYAGLGGGVELTFTSQFSDGKYRYADIPAAGSLASVNELMSMHGDNVIAEASRGESSRYIPDFADLPIDFYYYPASFRGEAEKTRLEVYYGLPADDISRATRADGDDLVAFDRAMALHDSTWNEVHRVTDQMVFRTPTDQQVEAGAFIPGVMPVNLEPGSYWMSLQIRDQASGKSQVYKQRIHLDDYAPRSDIQISDVELAFFVGETSDPEGEFLKNGLKVVPMSSKSFRRDQNAFVYFEVYNLTRDSFGQSRYQIEYTVRSHKERSAPAKIVHTIGRVLRVVEGDQEVKVSLEQTGNSDIDITYVELDITESRPGGQRVSVKVTDLLTEISAEKSITFSVDGF